MKGYRQLITEIKSRRVVFAFGRFQPPTIGHELLAKAVKRVATEQGADHVIFASRSEDKKSNPLNVKDKVYFLRRMFPLVNFMAAGDNTRTFIEVAKELNKKYKSITMVGGSDRVAEFKRILTTYNGKEFHFDSIEVMSAGERDPDSDTAAGMSGTKMRMAAKSGDFNKFKSGLPSTLTVVDSRRLFNKLRLGMGLEVIKEEIEFERDTVREDYHAGKILHIGEQVSDNTNNRFEIVSRGSNYVTVVDASGQLHRKWIFDVVTEIKKIDVSVISEGIFYKGYETQHLHKEVESLFFRSLAESDKDPFAVLNSIKIADELFEEYTDAKYEKLETYLSNIDMLEEWKTYNRKNLQEMKFNTADRIRVARIIGLSLGVPEVDKKSNPEQIVDMGLRKMRNKRFTPELRDLLNRMLDTAKMAKINYDEKLVPQTAKRQVEEEAQNFMTYYQFRQQLATIAKEISVPKDTMSVLPKSGSSMEPNNPRMAHRKAHHNIHEELGISLNDNSLDEVTAATADSTEKAAMTANVRAKHAREKHDLTKKHDRERENIKEEEDDKDEGEIINDDEFDDEINAIVDAEHILHLYDEDEFAFVDEDGNETDDDDEDDEQLDEALSRMERIKRRLRFTRTKTKRNRRRGIALKRRSTMEVINRRARKHAIIMLKKRLARKPLDKLSVQEKERLERIVQQRKKLIDRLAVRMAPKIRRIESDRLSKQRVKREEVEEAKDFSKYIMKSVKTEPKIVRKTNPAGRTTDHVEYEVHGTLSTQKKTFKTKKEAEAYFNTVKEELSTDEQFDLIEEMVMSLAELHNLDPETIWEKFESVDDNELLEAAVDAKGHKSSTGGLTQKGRDAFNAKGGNLQAPVTTPPSKLKSGSKAANRRKSFCARMGGMPGPMKDDKGRPTRKALALRKWNC